MVRMIESALNKQEKDCGVKKIMEAAKFLMQSCPVTEADAELFLRRIGEHLTLF